MKFKSLLKPFLAASTLGACAYYFNNKKSYPIYDWAIGGHVYPNPQNDKKIYFKHISDNKGLPSDKRDLDCISWHKMAALNSAENFEATDDHYIGETRSYLLIRQGFTGEDIIKSLDDWESNGLKKEVLDCFWEAYFIRKIQLGSNHPDTLLLKELLQEKDSNFARMHKMLFDKDLPSALPKEETLSDTSATHKQDVSSDITEKQNTSYQNVDPNQMDKTDVIGELNEFLHNEM